MIYSFNKKKEVEKGIISLATYLKNYLMISEISQNICISDTV